MSPQPLERTYLASKNLPSLEETYLASKGSCYASRKLGLRESYLAPRKLAPRKLGSKES